MFSQLLKICFDIILTNVSGLFEAEYNLVSGLVFLPPGPGVVQHRHAGLAASKAFKEELGGWWMVH